MNDINIQTPDKAICHLFLHCCFADGNFSENEIDQVAGIFVKLGLENNLDFKKELVDYRSYRSNITDEKEYLSFLINLFQPTNARALLSYCLELAVSDTKLDIFEEKFFRNLSEVLSVDKTEQRIIQELMIERKLVESNQFF